jgi:hypothetical protein
MDELTRVMIAALVGGFIGSFAYSLFISIVFGSDDE